MLIKTGVPTTEDIALVTPPADRLRKGPVAVIECYQEIPCDPCCSACPRGAIREMKDINDRPIIDYDKCNGCGLCIPVCPGLAISVVDMTCAGEQASVRIPYEFRPLPRKGQRVAALDREGLQVCEATVTHVLNTKSVDRTPVVTLNMPREYAMEARFFRTDGGAAAVGDAENRSAENGSAGDKGCHKNYLCRCEEVTVEEVRNLIRKGCTSVDEIKRLSRAGMGPCQGRTCRHLIMREIAAQTGINASEQQLPAFRPPVKPIRMGMMIGVESEDE